MFAYYLELAVRSLRRNIVLTALMIAAVGVGIGASMTMLTTLVALSTNPIPDKSSQLFVPQIDGSGYATLHHDLRSLPRTLAYRDAMAFVKVHPGTRQAAMYRLALNVKPPEGDRFPAGGRATDSDFFAMFEVPFHAGAPWGHNEDVHRDNVVVLSDRLSGRLFPGADAVGKTINLGKRDYRIIGVLHPWIPTPRFYDANAGAYSQDEDFFVPFSTAIERQIESNDYECNETERPGDWAGILSSECPWVQFWAELPEAGQVRGFRSFMQNYAAEQQRQGRFRWLPMVALRDVSEWLANLRVVPNDVRVNSMIAIGFLIVCLINAVGLMLAKFTSRAVELSVRRALGASRANLFLQCVTEALLVGLLGGVLGLGLTTAGLFALRGLQGVTSQDSVAGKLVSLNGEMVLITLAVAIVATICSGLYPAWRASRVQPGWQLKAQ
ncbi:MAG TPA: ABC transporter permease [Steroidobacteraceae bacterium]|jgi:putative ABC transport system permease protein|nr:ABC transporter permease [Steroidobacteraceae bacterium]